MSAIDKCKAILFTAFADQAVPVMARHAGNAESCSADIEHRPHLSPNRS